MLFVSKIRDLRLIKKPASKVIDANGQPYYTSGERVEFSNFRYSTTDPVLIEWLCNHQMYGNTFTSDKMKDKGTKQAKLNNDYDAIQLARSTVKNFDAGTIAPEDQFNQAEKNKAKEKKKIPIPAMIKGMMATAQSFDVPQREVSKTEREPAPRAEALTREVVAGMINSAMAQIVDLIKANSKKAAFHCKICGKEFASGVEVGRHKKVEHAGPTGPAETPEVTE